MHIHVPVVWTFPLLQTPPPDHSHLDEPVDHIPTCCHSTYPAGRFERPLHHTLEGGGGEGGREGGGREGEEVTTTITVV